MSKNIKVFQWLSKSRFFSVITKVNPTCKTAIWADEIALNSSCEKLSDFLQQVEIAMSCNLILKIKIIGKYLHFSSASFWFLTVKIWYLKLSIQAQTLKAVSLRINALNI